MNSYLIAFGSEGIEVLLDITKYDPDSPDALFVKLKGEKEDNEFSQMLNSMSLRFRMNAHRRIEVYAIKLEAGTAELIEKLLIDNDEATKQLIRKSGEKVII